MQQKLNWVKGANGALAATPLVPANVFLSIRPDGDGWTLTIERRRLVDGSTYQSLTTTGLASLPRAKAAAPALLAALISA